MDILIALLITILVPLAILGVILTHELIYSTKEDITISDFILYLAKKGRYYNELDK
jgi:hypothetical protein